MSYHLTAVIEVNQFLRGKSPMSVYRLSTAQVNGCPFLTRCGRTRRMKAGGYLGRPMAEVAKSGWRQGGKRVVGREKRTRRDSREGVEKE